MQWDQLAIVIGFGLFGLGPILGLVLARKRLGTLNAASWLVVWGAVIIAIEHAQFAISYSLSFKLTEDGPLTLPPHARLHFFMAGIYVLIGMVMLGVIARTLLKEGRPAGWYAVLFALLVGSAFDVLAGDLWYQHGSPLYQVLGVSPILGFGWSALYGYMVAWMAALLTAYGPIFGKAPGARMRAESGGGR